MQMSGTGKFLLGQVLQDAQFVKILATYMSCSRFDFLLDRVLQDA